MVSIDNLLTTTNSETPDGERHTLGWSTGRSTITAFHLFAADVTHPPLPKHYAETPNGDFVEVCGRCGGGGNVGYGPDSGVCYLCLGYGSIKDLLSADELTAKLTRWVKRALAESRAAERRIAARTAECQAWLAGHAELVTWAKELTPSRIDRDVDSYITDAATEDEAKVGRGWFQERMLWVNFYENSQRWGACFIYDEERFLQFGDKPDNMIRRVREDFALDGRETGYLTKVMESAKSQKADPKAAASRHAGEIGQRLAITGKVTTVREMNEGEYLLVKVEGLGQDAGVTFATFSSGEGAWARKEGELVTMKATIKGRDEHKGIKSDRVGRAVFTVVDETAIKEAPAVTETPAPAATPEPAEATATPAEAPATPVTAQQPAARATRRQTQGASVVDGWEVLYDKPRAKAQVVKNTDGAYGLVCTDHKTLHPLDRLTDERALRNGPRSGWCTECS